MTGSFDFVDLEQPVGGGIESVNFFNGRLLTAGDMTREQRARRETEARLGEALGDGIVFGLEASAIPPDTEEPLVSILVQPGLAISGAGQLLRLDQPERIRLSRVDSTSFAAGGCQFDDCVPMSAGTYVAGEGLYLLTIAPAERSLGRAPSNGLGAAGTPCDVDRRVDSVRFRLLEVPPKLYAKLQVLKPDFRNRLAYECFGPGVLADWATFLPGGGARSPAIEGERSLIDRMAAAGLTEREVPLALIGFQGVAELTLLDGWSVRRPVSLADVPGAFHSALAPRREATGRAMFAQFQEHLADLRAADTPELKARTHFPFLPPVGVLPRMSFDEGREFLGGMAVRGPIHINSATVELLIRESLTHPAIRSEGLEVIWLYAVAENQIAAMNALAGKAVADPYLIFASANLAYRGDARFNLHRWNYANYALGGG
ncbi:MAG TPA: hypothetical protein VF619_08675 [Allosphingosinicella sp.]|jgi:hypothetical protein